MGIHRWPVYSPHRGTVTRKMFPGYAAICSRDCYYGCFPHCETARVINIKIIYEWTRKQSVAMVHMLVTYTPWWAPRKRQATGLDAWASRVKCPARFVSHLHEICIYIWVVYSFCLFCCLFIIVTWWYMWCIVWQVAIKKKYRHVW